MEKIVQPIYEDNHLLIVNKPAGILIQGDSTGDKPLVEHCKDYIKKKYNKPGAVFLHPVHRLDRPVSGVIVFARTSKALERMNKIFATRKVQKTYWAIVKKHPPQKKGKLISWLVKDTKRNVTTAYSEPVDGGLKAETNFKWMGKLRAEKPGRALIQTHMPDHEALVALAAGDREGFIAAELGMREILGLPPYGKLAAIIISAPDAKKADEFAKKTLNAAPRADGIEILGPSEAPMAILRGRHRRRLLIKSEPNVNLSAYMAIWKSRLRPPHKTKLAIDIDPQGFM